MKINETSRRDRMRKAAELYLETIGFEKAMVTGEMTMRIGEGTEHALTLKFFGRKQQEPSKQLELGPADVVMMQAEECAIKDNVIEDLQAGPVNGLDRIAESFERGPAKAPTTL